MELLFRLFGVLQILILTVLEPIYWIIAKLENTVPLQPIKKPELCMSATEMAAKIRSGEISCEEVMQRFIFRCKRINIKLNAVVEERYEAALQEAEKVDKLIASKTKTIEEMEFETPLLGVPVTVKESCKLKGMSFSVGSKLRVGLRADSDGVAVDRIRKAGAIPLLVSNTPELCLASETFNHITGLTRNPYDVHRTVGGSSGGEASLISSAGSVIGIGSDLVGSILAPSMFTGIFGHRPTPRIIPVEGHCPGGDVDQLANHLVVGPMTRYAEDLPLMTRIMAGDNAPQLRLDQKVDMKQLRVFYMTGFNHSLGIPSVDKEIKQSIQKSVEYLRTSFNCVTQEANFSEMSDAPEIVKSVLFSIKNIPDVFQMTNFPSPKDILSMYTEFFKSLFGLSTFSYLTLLSSLIKRSHEKTAHETNALYIKQNADLKKRILETLGDSGVLICPTYPSAAHYHHQSLLRTLAISLCGIISTLGLPSTNVPMGLNKKGLPIGFQVVAAPCQDRLCFAVAKELEAAFGGWVHPPCLQTLSHNNC